MKKETNMSWNWSLIQTVNLVFCAIIFAIGYASFVKKGSKIIWDIGTAFGLFGLSHVLSIAGFENQNILLIIIAIAYLLVISALLKALILK